MNDNEYMFCTDAVLREDLDKLKGNIVKIEKSVKPDEKFKTDTKEKLELLENMILNMNLIHSEEREKLSDKICRLENQLKNNVQKTIEMKETFTKQIKSLEENNRKLKNNLEKHNEESSMAIFDIEKDIQNLSEKTNNLNNRIDYTDQAVNYLRLRKPIDVIKNTKLIKYITDQLTDTWYASSNFINNIKQ